MAAKSRSWRLGEILIQNGWITWEQLEKALEMQRSSSAQDMGDILVAKGFLDEKQAQLLNLGEILIRHKLITWDQLTEALKIQKQTGEIIGRVLVKKKFVSEKNLYRALALQFNMTFVDFNKVDIPPETLGLIDKSLAYELRTLPLIKKDNVLLIAITDPNDVRPEAELRKRVEWDIRVALAAPSDMESALQKYYGPEFEGGSKSAV